MDIKDFCRYCDCGPKGFADCKIQGSYVPNGQCGWSTIQGLKVITYENRITILDSDETILREDIRKLREAIAVQKNLDNGPFLRPNQSPF
jgi:hypothetical protein